MKISISKLLEIKKSNLFNIYRNYIDNFSISNTLEKIDKTFWDQQFFLKISESEFSCKCSFKVFVNQINFICKFCKSY